MNFLPVDAELKKDQDGIEVIETSDIYFIAFCLSKNYKIWSIQLIPPDKMLFLFKGPGLSTLLKNYLHISVYIDLFYFIICYNDIIYFKEILRSTQSGNEQLKLKYLKKIIFYSYGRVN